MDLHKQSSCNRASSTRIYDPMEKQQMLDAIIIFVLYSSLQMKMVDTNNHTHSFCNKNIAWTWSITLI